MFTLILSVFRNIQSGLPGYYFFGTIMSS